MTGSLHRNEPEKKNEFREKRESIRKQLAAAVKVRAAGGVCVGYTAIHREHKHAQRWTQAA